VGEREAGARGLSAGAGARRPPWSAFRDALTEAGFRPTRTRGQNFLVDPNVHAAIVRDAAVQEGERVLEVGTGCGFLSVHLAEAGVELLTVEIDPRLAEIAGRFLSPYPNVRVLVADALAGKHRLDPALEASLRDFTPYHLVANLPYSIAAPLVAVLARSSFAPRSFTVLVQKEVALRLSARPGDGSWGALSARLAARYEGELGRDVGAQLFWPRPRVESAVVHLRRRDDVPGEGLLEALERVIEVAFRHPRRQLPGALEGLYGSKAEALRVLEGLEIDSRNRPGDLSRGDLLRLAGTLC